MPASTRLMLWMSCFVIGIAVGATHAIHAVTLAWVAAMLASLAGFQRRSRTARIPFLVGGGLVLGIWYVSAWRSAAPISWAFDRETSFLATVVAPPDRRDTKTLLTVLPEGSAGSKILVSAGRYPAFRYGDKIRIQGTIERPATFESFDYPLYLEKDRVYGTVSKPRKLSLVGSGGANPLLGQLYRLRDAVEGTVQRTIPEPEAGFLNGIMLGSKRSVPADLQAALQATGTSHIIAISGANITILLDILLQVLPLYTLRQQFWATVMIALFMCLLTGASASVVRGGLIACLGRYARLNSRQAWTFPLILTGLCLMLLESPLMLVADPGFQLSFAAFAGLGWLGSPCKKVIDASRLCRNWPEAMRGSLAETVAASIGTAPISFTLFGQLSLLGFVVNPLILWLLPAVTLIGILLCVAGWVPAVPFLLQLPLWLCLHVILGIISWFGKLDIGLVHWQPSWTLSIGSWAAAIIAFLMAGKALRHARP